MSTSRRARKAFTLRLQEPALDEYCRALDLEDLDLACRGLAEAIARSPGWPSEARASLLYEPGPPRRFSILGTFSDEEALWIEAQSQALQRALPHFRFLGYQAVHNAVERLADDLLDRVGRQRLEAARWMAIPRGGWVVLGLLSVALGVTANSLQDDSSGEDLTIVVDDCALSGARFRTSVAGNACRETHFATLISPRPLREAIEKKERNVVCHSALDLDQLEQAGSETSRASPPSWTPKAYWMGATRALAFPWNEPDQLIWCRAEDGPVKAWGLAPPSHCLKKRLAASGIELVA